MSVASSYLADFKGKNFDFSSSTLIFSVHFFYSLPLSSKEDLFLDLATFEENVRETTHLGGWMFFSVVSLHLPHNSRVNTICFKFLSWHHSISRYYFFFVSAKIWCTTRRKPKVSVTFHNLLICLTSCVLARLSLFQPVILCLHVLDNSLEFSSSSLSSWYWQSFLLEIFNFYLM